MPCGHSVNEFVINEWLNSCLPALCLCDNERDSGLIPWLPIHSALVDGRAIVAGERARVDARNSSEPRYLNIEVFLHAGPLPISRSLCKISLHQNNSASDHAEL